MSGRWLVLGLLGFAALFGVVLVYMQYFAFYQRVEGVETLRFGRYAIPVAGYAGLDAASSPLKLRGCFTLDPAALDGLPPATEATPLTPPPWFRCFDAEALGHDLDTGAARAYRLAEDAPEAFDVMLAAYPDGRGFLWRQLGARFTD
jgi:hypothetical protein